MPMEQQFHWSLKLIVGVDSQRREQEEKQAAASEGLEESLEFRVLKSPFLRNSLEPSGCQHCFLCC